MVRRRESCHFDESGMYEGEWCHTHGVIHVNSEMGSFPASFQKDRAQALHELWSAATNFDVAMSEEGFRDALAAARLDPWQPENGDET